MGTEGEEVGQRKWEVDVGCKRRPYKWEVKKEMEAKIGSLSGKCKWDVEKGSLKGKCVLMGMGNESNGKWK